MARTQEMLTELASLRQMFSEQSAAYREQVFRELKRQREEINANSEAIVELRISVAVAKTKIALWSIAGATAVAAIVMAIMELILK